MLLVVQKTRRGAARPRAVVLLALTTLAALLLGMLPAAPVAAAAPARAPRSPQRQSSDSLVDIVEAHNNPVALTLAASGPAGPGGTVSFTLNAELAMEAPQVRLTWMLPDGGELLGGPADEALPWTAAVQSLRQVRFPAEGIYRVMASVAIQPGAEEAYSGLGVLFFDVRHASARVSTRDLAAVDPRTVPMGTSVEQLATTAERPPEASDPSLEPESTTPDGVAPDGAQPARASEPNDPCFKISGTVTRTERRPISTGLQIGIPVPVTNAIIFMREEDSLFDDEYASSFTDAQGRYSFAFCDDDGVFDDDLEIYVRLRAELFSAGKSVVEITDSSWVDETYEFDSNVIESDGGTYVINFNLNEEQSGIFNIADAVFQAWSFWNESGGATGDDAIFDEQVEVHWEAGYGDIGSYYSPFTGEMTIADDPSDPDQWDDGVIMHEWGHMADDFYGCDDNGGGPHNVDTLINDVELTWGEGYPNYYQSAVRQARGYIDSRFYLDMNSAGMPNISISLESYDSTRAASLLSERNEMAIAAMLWDLNDNIDDGRLTGGGPAMAPVDRVSHGHRMIQRVYTDPVFESNGDVFDDNCTSFVYLESWRDLSLPTDGATAEAITKNIGRANPFNLPATVATANVVALDPAAVLAAPSGAEDYQWWQRLTYVVDNSASMAGLKLDGIKTAMIEQASDLGAAPNGAEFDLFTFNNSDLSIQPFFRDYFTVANATTGINAIAPSGAADPGCPVNGLSALNQAAQGMRGGQAWLYTDGDSVQVPNANTLRRTLSDRGVRGSVVLLVGCGTGPQPQPDVSSTFKSYMGLAANSTQPGGIVPYLLTALGSGGQFLYVNQNQLANVGDVLRAQLSHTAGAGRWSDYVSDDFTYRWDKLDPNEFQWFPIDLSTLAGNLGTPVDIPLSGPFTYWGGSRSTARVYEDGYIRFNPCEPGNTVCTILPRGFLNLLKGSLNWASISPPPSLAATTPLTPTMLPDEGARPAGMDAEVAPDAIAAACYSGSNYGLQARAYTANLGINEWQIITIQGQANYGNVSFPCRAFQVWLNQQTGEIIYQYLLTNGESASADIGLLQQYSFVGAQPDELLVSRNDLNGAVNNSGYRFTPAPPQPTKVHTVTVDSLMTSIGFLQTGFSGDFEPLAVTDPAGAAISCADTANVLCLTVDNSPGDRSVQYVQVKVSGRTGVWSAVVDAGSARQATYSFTSMALSDLEVEGFHDRQAPSFKQSRLLVGLQNALDGNTVQAWLQKPNGQRWGSPFTLYDDGAHGDGQAGDGQFGLLDFQPPGRGVAWLWVQGALGGQTFQRMDPAPLSFQPVELTVLTPGVIPSDGSAFPVALRIESRDPSQRCYIPSFEAPPGWYVEWELGEGYPCLNNGESVERTITIYPDWSTINAAAGDAIAATRSGAQAVIGVSVQDSYDDAIADSAEIPIQWFKPAAEIIIDDEPFFQYLRPNGTDSAPVIVRVLDEDGMDVADGTPVSLSTSGGTLGATNLTTVLGRVQTTYTAPTVPGDYTITAQTGALEATVNVMVRDAIASQILLTASPANLSQATSSSLVATVLDEFGDPVANATVVIGVEGDGQTGRLASGEVLTGTTNAQGRLSTTYTKATGVPGPVGVRAVLYSSTGEPLHEARVLLLMTTQRRVFMPFVRR